MFADEFEGVGVIVETDGRWDRVVGVVDVTAALLGDRDLYDGMCARSLATAPKYDRAARAATSVSGIRRIGRSAAAFPIVDRRAAAYLLGRLGDRP